MDRLTGIQAMHELAIDGPLPTILIPAHYRRADVASDLDGDQVLAFLAKPIKFADLTAVVANAARKLL